MKDFKERINKEYQEYRNNLVEFYENHRGEQSPILVALDCSSHSFLIVRDIHEKLINLSEEEINSSNIEKMMTWSNILLLLASTFFTKRYTTGYDTKQFITDIISNVDKIDDMLK